MSLSSSKWQNPGQFLSLTSSLRYEKASLTTSSNGRFDLALAACVDQTHVIETGAGKRHLNHRFAHGEAGFPQT